MDKKNKMQHNNDITMQLIANRLDTIHEEVGTLRASIHIDLKGVIENMSSAVNKLIALEERHTAMNHNYERLEKQLEKADSKFGQLESRVDMLEKDAPETKRVTGWVMSAIYGALALIASGAAKYFGFI